MPPETDEVRKWVTKARHDWSATRKILTPDCTETDVAAFHCQQAVEKLLKAYLVSRRIRFERIHDLGRLLDYCAAEDPQFETLRDDIEPLTVYATAFRYPGPAEPTREEVLSASEAVERVWTFLSARLPGETMS